MNSERKGFETVGANRCLVTVDSGHTVASVVARAIFRRCAFDVYRWMPTAFEERVTNSESTSRTAPSGRAQTAAARAERPQSLWQCFDVLFRPRLPADWPNLLTVSRLVLTVFVLPPLAVAFLVSGAAAWAWGLAALTGLLASTDWVDGRIARKYALTSEFGAWLDPLADKIFTLICWALVIALLFAFEPAWVAVLIAVGVAATLLREWMVNRWRKSFKFAADIFGKIKTFAQMVAIVFFFLAFNPDLDASRWVLAAFAYGLFALQLLTAWYSAWNYRRQIRTGHAPPLSPQRESQPAPQEPQEHGRTAPHVPSL